MLKAGINASRDGWDNVYDSAVVQAFRRHLDFDEGLLLDGPSPRNIKRSLEGAEVVLSTWGAMPLDEELLEACPDLKLVLYAAGSVKGFVTEALIRRKVLVTSAVRQNARPVAEFTLGLILSSLKNVVTHNQDLKARGPAAWKKDKAGYPGGYYKTKVGIIGDGTIARMLLELLRPFDMEVFIDSVYYTDEDQARYGARKAGLEEIMAGCDVVTLHHADIPENWNLMNKDNLRLMKPGARLINTSRGRLINEKDLVERLEKGDITAYLDVTHPEPPAADHAFYRLPNCILTPHIAGSIGREMGRMSAFMLEELERWLRGEPLQGAVDLAGLADRA